MPLGRLRFLAETGIREADWLGKFWARWGDALREAGYSPNELQPAYETDYLLEAYIGLIRELKTVHVIRTDDPAGIEAYWHRRFEEKRKNGEWFDLGAAEVAAFKRRKFM